MSNFICSECGMTNIDCGKKGYKTPREIELEKKLNIAVKALEQYANEKNWRDSTTEFNTDFFEYKNSMYKMEQNGFEEAKTALKQIKEEK